MTDPLQESIASVPAACQALEECISTHDRKRALSILHGLPKTETPLAVSRLPYEKQSELLSLLRPNAAAGILASLHDEYAADLIEDLPARLAGSILEHMNSADQADLLGELNRETANAVMQQMTTEGSSDVRRLLEFDKDTAGGRMVTEYLAYHISSDISHILKDIREKHEYYAKYDIQYFYVVDHQGILNGVLSIRDLLFRSERIPLKELMMTNLYTVNVSDTLESLDHFFREHNFFGVPVVDEIGRLVGVVKRSDVRQALQEISERQFLHLSGIFGGEEFRSMPVLQRTGRRGAWLVINIALNLLGATVIAAHQDTLQAAIALAVFLPIISDMSGCSGNQAVAVSIRELTLGLLKPNEIFRVVVKEGRVGLINGLCLGTLIGVLAWLWKSNVYLGIVVGGALAINTILSVCLGGILPLIAKRLRLDPAMVSGPLLTTCTDVCGFFLILTGAKIVLEKLI